MQPSTIFVFAVSTRLKYLAKPRGSVRIFGLGARWYVVSRGEERRRFIRLGGVAGHVAFSRATVMAVFNEMSSPRWFGHSEGP